MSKKKRFGNTTQPVRNYRCQKKLKNYDNHSVLNECSRYLTEYKLTEHLGSGSFGEVFKGTSRDPGSGEIMDIAVKKIAKVDRDTLGDMFKEIEFSYYMGEVGIAPVIYDAFFIPMYSGYEKKDQIEKNITHFIQYVIMEPMDISVYDILKDENMSIDKKSDIVSQMIGILKRQLYEFGMTCPDVKPQNFVYRKTDHVVKIIDFGADYCTYGSKDIETSNIYYLCILIQLYLLLDAYNAPYLDSCDRYRLFKSFYKDSIFKNRRSFTKGLIKLLNSNSEFSNKLLRIFKHYVLNRMKSKTHFSGNIQTDIPVLMDFMDQKEFRYLYGNSYISYIIDNNYKKMDNFYKENRPDPNYFKNKQKHTNFKMRTVLIDWLMELHIKFELSEQTLFICVYCIDKYLSINIKMNDLQLCGCVALYIASKYTDYPYPDPSDFVRISPFNLEQFHKMLEDMSKHLDPILHSKDLIGIDFPTSYSFTNLYSYIPGVVVPTNRDENIQKKVLKYTLLGYNMLEHDPSLIAAAVYYYVHKEWPFGLKNLTGYQVNKKLQTILKNLTGYKVRNIESIKSVVKLIDIIPKNNIIENGLPPLLPPNKPK